MSWGLWVDYGEGDGFELMSEYATEQAAKDVARAMNRVGGRRTFIVHQPDRPTK